MKRYIIYKVTNLINRRYYIGRHSTNNLDDNYLGSGKAIINAVKKYGKDTFKKEFAEILKSISLDMNQNEFQRQVGKMEVLGELLIRDKK